MDTLSITINNLQKENVHLNPDAPLVGIPTWTVQTGDATVAPAADGLSCFIISGTLLADSTILVQGEGDPTPGVDTLKGQVTVHVIAPEATRLGLSADSPVLK